MTGMDEEAKRYVAMPEVRPATIQEPDFESLREAADGIRAERRKEMQIMINAALEPLMAQIGKLRDEIAELRQKQPK